MGEDIQVSGSLVYTRLAIGFGEGLTEAENQSGYQGADYAGRCQWPTYHWSDSIYEDWETVQACCRLAEYA